MANPQNDNNAGISAGQVSAELKQSKIESIYDKLSNLLGEKVFDCDRCKKLLKPPACHVTDVGTVCKTCADENNWTDDGENRLMEKCNVVLRSTAVVHCTTEECRAPVLDGDLECHLQKHCKYRLVNCISDNCPWAYRLIDLVHHFEAEHRKDVMTEPEPFTFVVDVYADAFVVSKLLIREHDRFLVWLRREPKSDVFTYKLLNAQFEDEIDHDFRVTARLVANDNRIFSIDLAIAPLNMIDDPTVGVQVVVENLKIILSRGYSKLMTLEIPSNETARLLRWLQCPACLELVRPPIYQCEEGHSVCTRCSPDNSLQCSWCQRNVEIRVRNYTLEAATVLYPCVNRSRGCETKMLGAQNMDLHESTCFYTIYGCPSQNFTHRCDYEGNFASLKNHIRLTHPEVLIEQTGCWFHFKSKNNYSKKIYLLRECDIFEVHFRHTPHYDNKQLISSCTVRSLMPASRYLKVCCNVSICDLDEARETRYRLLLTKEETQAKAYFHPESFAEGYYFNGKNGLIFSAEFENETKLTMIGRGKHIK